MRGFKHFLSEPLRTPDLMLRGIGYHEPMRAGLVHRPTGTGDVLVMLLHSPAIISCEVSSDIHPAGCAMVWSRDRGHYYGNPSRAWLHTWVHCDGPAVQRAIGESSLPMNQPTLLSNPTAVEQGVLTLHEELSEHPTPDETILRNTLETMLRQIARGMRPAEKQAGPPAALLAVRKHMATHCEQPMTLEDLAALADLSASHFAALFRKHFRMPPIEFVIRHRMMRAEYLLADEHRRIAAIAQEVGYEDPLHFSKMFRKHAGCSPQAYRRSLSG